MKHNYFNVFILTGHKKKWEKRYQKKDRKPSIIYREKDCGALSTYRVRFLCRHLIYLSASRLPSNHCIYHLCVCVCAQVNVHRIYIWKWAGRSQTHGYPQAVHTWSRVLGDRLCHDLIRPSVPPINCIAYSSTAANLEKEKGCSLSIQSLYLASSGWVRNSGIPIDTGVSMNSNMHKVLINKICSTKIETNK